MKLVVALGGNALLQRGEPPTAEVQRGHAGEAMAAVAELARDHDLVLTHGNGPQVGLLALQALGVHGGPALPARRARRRERGHDRLRARAGAREPAPRPDRRHAPHAGGRRSATTRRSPHPTKPIGADLHGGARAQRLAAELGWSIAPDNEHFRRVVASPQPLRIVELAAIRTLVDSGALVVCSGGGGIPVILDPRRHAARRRGRDRQGPRRRAARAQPRRRLPAHAHRRQCGAWSGWGAPDPQPHPPARRRPSCARSTSRPARWARRSRPPAASSRPPAAPPRSAPSRTPSTIVAGRAGTTVAPA